MTTLSSAGWIVHDIGLATTIGGGLFGQVAMEPALDRISDPQERDSMSEKAWNRYSFLKLASHAAFAVPWFIGRGMLSGREVSSRARALTLAKDALVIASLASGVSAFVIGRILRRKTQRGAGPDAVRAGEANEPESPMLERAVAIVGAVNQLTTTGVLAVTSLLAMEGSDSFKFAAATKKLP